MIKTLLLVLSVASLARAASNLPAHPRLILPDSDLPQVKHRIDQFPWAKTAFADLKKRADEQLKTPLDIPDRGGQWSHYYACPKHGARLRTEGPTKHVCPIDGEVFTGWPYDDVVIMQRHDQLASAARDLGLMYRITADKRYADKSREILLAYAQRYLTYALHNKDNKPVVGGGRVASQSLTESTWLIKMTQAADCVWDTLSEGEIDALREKLFYPAAVDVIQKHHMPIHNIQCWKNTAVGLVGFLFGDEKLIADSIDGEVGCRQQIAQGITADGMWHEGSWSYHFYTISALMPLTEAARICGINLYNDKLKSMFTAPILMAMPDGELPAFNDSSPSTAIGNADYELALARFSNEPLLARAIKGRSNTQALLQGVESLPTRSEATPISQNFPSTGYAILKSSDATSWLCLKYGPHGGWHGHPDKNSFVLYANGRIIAGDPGTCAYGVPLHKEWYRTTIAHNTLTIDQTNQKEATGSCLAFIADKNYSAAMIDAGSAIDGRFRRSAFLLASDLIVFIDQLNLNDSKHHTLDFAYHPQGEWSERPPGQPTTMPAIDGYKHLRDMIALDSNDPLTLRTQHASVTFAPGDKTRFLVGTGIGRQAEDRVPAAIVRRRGSATVLMWVVRIGSGPAPKLESLTVTNAAKQSLAPDKAAAARLICDNKTWLLIANPEARDVSIDGYIGNAKLLAITGR